MYVWVFDSVRNPGLFCAKLSSMEFTLAKNYRWKYGSRAFEDTFAVGKRSVFEVVCVPTDSFEPLRSIDSVSWYSASN
jgi:hypothetical protein